jgi:hypothetical protein
MDIFLAFCLFGFVFLLPLGFILAVNARWRKIGFGLAGISVLGLAGTITALLTGAGAGPH